MSRLGPLCLYLHTAVPRHVHATARYRLRFRVAPPLFPSNICLNHKVSVSFLARVYCNTCGRPPRQWGTYCLACVQVHRGRTKFNVLDPHPHPHPHHAPQARPAPTCCRCRRVPHCHCCRIRNPKLLLTLVVLVLLNSVQLKCWGGSRCRLLLLLLLLLFFLLATAHRW